MTKQTKHRMIVSYKADHLSNEIKNFLEGLTQHDTVVSTQLVHTMIPHELRTNLPSVFTYIIIYEHDEQQA